MSSYRYGGEPPTRVFGALPEGDYSFVVATADEPYTNPKSGNLVLPLRLNILPDMVPVFANPWCSTDPEEKKKRDDIAAFLSAVNRLPKVGEEPDWAKLVGARGKCRIKVEIAQQGALAGKERNVVAFFHRPKQVGPQAAAAPQRQSFTEAEIEASQAKIAQVLGIKEDVEPDDIPF